jgi:hypothetical protein
MLLSRRKGMRRGDEERRTFETDTSGSRSENDPFAKSAPPAFHQASKNALQRSVDGDAKI